MNTYIIKIINSLNLNLNMLGLTSCEIHIIFSLVHN